MQVSCTVGKVSWKAVPLGTKTRQEDGRVLEPCATRLCAGGNWMYSVLIRQPFLFLSSLQMKAIHLFLSHLAFCDSASAFPQLSPGL